ncbi:two-component system response regulator [Algoriphagus sp. NG3]|uniref:response regulator n=1 Tax=Algoriphagus sp. NG3 TaxID=3097546 RepID=UPI002A815EE2|nr:response regulator [Algoriphagus sp. NG3]WPR76448.1 response regulator [Algoriphagus sp. NG3]
MKTEIILIDDDPISLLLSKFLLEKTNVPSKTIKLTPFDEPQEGLKYILNLVNDDKTDKCKLKVLLDINMPVLNGWEFLSQLNKFDPEKQIRVIMHSSSKWEQDITLALTDSRVDCYITKPMEARKAMQVVDFFIK